MNSEIEDNRKDAVEEVDEEQVGTNANVISSHIEYKNKVESIR